MKGEEGKKECSTTAGRKKGFDTSQCSTTASTVNISTTFFVVVVHQENHGVSQGKIFLIKFKNNVLLFMGKIKILI